MTESAALRSFLADLAAGGRPKTATYGLASFRDLEGAERRAAERLLIERARLGDLRAIETLGLGGATRALAVLERMSKASGDVGTAAARAVLQLMGPDGAATARVAEGVKSPSPSQSAFAAFELRSAEGDDAIAGLIEALAHPFVATRANAMLGLEEKLALAPWIEPRQSPLWTLMMRAMTDFPSVYVPAAKELQRILRRLIAGTPPAELGLVYVRSSPEAAIDRVWTPAPDGYDFDALLDLRGHDLEWAKAYLLLKLDQRDDRVPEAMVMLGMTEELPALLRATERAEARGAGDLHRSAIEALQAQSAAIGDA